VLVTDPVGGDASVITAALAPHELVTLIPTPDKSWRELANEADALIVNLAPIDADALAGLARCRVIARLGVGMNNIDIAAARAQGIIITNVPDYCREEVSDHALTLMLTLLRKVPLAHADIQNGHWDQLRYRPIRRLNTLTLGLIGFGKLAQALTRKAAALGMRVIAHDPYATPNPENRVPLLSLDEVLGQADVVSLHAPLVAETKGLIGASALRAMKRGAILVNTSRGELVDESALISALDSSWLAGAALDVFASEPLSLDSPLRGRVNVVMTPHIAFYSEDSLIDLQRTAAEDVARALMGQTPRYGAA
jgi:D-3-phosphoglycerate dehydrogenase